MNTSIVLNNQSQDEVVNLSIILPNIFPGLVLYIANEEYVVTKHWYNVDDGLELVIEVFKKRNV